MAIEFRCEKCGKLLDLDAEPGGTVKCPHCRSDVTVPAALASLPRPQIPPDTPPAPQPPPLPAGEPAPGDAPQAEAEEIPDEEETGDAVLSVMAHLMPWVISLFLHAGLALIFLFAVMFTMVEDQEVGGATDAYKTEPRENIDHQADLLQRNLSRERRASRQTMSRNESISDSSKTVSRIRIGAGGGADGALDRFKLGGSGEDQGFYNSRSGSGNPAYHFVYVIDRSGSMMDTFDDVRKEMRRSISRLRPPQDFHVIFFAGGDPIELQSRKLVPATDANKMDVHEFLDPGTNNRIRPEGQTDPVPALERAFSVLSGANNKPGQIIYLLTDGVFPDNNKVLATVRARNSAKKVLIYTFLYGTRPPEAEEVMKKIASENGGDYKFIRMTE